MVIALAVLVGFVVYHVVSSSSTAELSVLRVGQAKQWLKRAPTKCLPLSCADRTMVGLFSGRKATYWQYFQDCLARKPCLRAFFCLHPSSRSADVNARRCALHISRMRGSWDDGEPRNCRWTFQ